MREKIKELIRERIEQAMTVYNRHRVFVISLSYKELSGAQVCVVYPKSHKMPGRWNPMAFNHGVLFRSAWKERPDRILDWIEEHWM